MSQTNSIHNSEASSITNNSNSSDSIHIKTEADAKHYLSNILLEIKTLFGVRATKKILKAAGKLAGITNDSKEVIHQLQPINIALYQQIIKRFNDVSTAYRMNMIEPNSSIDTIYQSCRETHSKILQFKQTKWASEVAEFGGFLHMHKLFQMGNKCSNPNEFHKNMKAYNKYKAKCRRVNEIAEVLNPQTAVLLAYNLNIATLENANKQDWNAIIQEITNCKELRDFSKTIELDANGLLRSSKPSLPCALV